VTRILYNVSFGQDYMIHPCKKTTKQLKRIPNPGQYSLDGEELEWESCRENFSKKFNEKSLGLFFSYAGNQDESLSSFIEKTEDILINAALQNLNKSRFFKTNFNFAIWIEPSSFWMFCPMRRSLFTMLLRCGLNYNFNNYEEALYSIQYSKITKLAIQRFLYGFTDFVNKGENLEGIGRGWVSFFGNRGTDVVCEKLKRPHCLNENKFLFGEEVLWA